MIQWGDGKTIEDPVFRCHLSGGHRGQGGIGVRPIGEHRGQTDLEFFVEWGGIGVRPIGGHRGQTDLGGIGVRPI